MPQQTIPASESIAALQAQLQQFRSTHPTRTRLPPSVWEAATELARRHGIYLVARSLRLDYCTLKKRLNGSGTVPNQVRKKAQPRFVELIGAAPASTDEYVMEFKSVRGRKLRIQCKTNKPPDWRVLLRAWRRMER